MLDNPYQSPRIDRTDSVAPKHRSFRLTPEVALSDGSIKVWTFGEALVFALVEQLPLLLLAALLLDGGMIFKQVGVTSLVFWIMVLMIMIRRGEDVTKMDILIVKWGFFGLLLAVVMIWNGAQVFFL